MLPDNRILITRKIPREGLKIIKKFTSNITIHHSFIPHHNLVKLVGDKEGILCMLNDRIDRKVIQSAKNLRVISLMAAGYDNVDIEFAKKRGIVVTNTPGVLTEATADLAWALLCAVARRVVEADRFVREDKQAIWDPLLFLGADIYGKTIGIIGAGKIGQAVGRRATGFDMKILYNSRTPKPRFEKQTKARFVKLDKLLRESDFVVLNCPLTSSTFHLIKKRELKKMKKSAFLINVARGPVVKEKDLVWALKQGVIAGAGLDVYEFEPEISKELLNLQNVVLLPHIGSASTHTRTKMAIMAAENLVAVLKGKPPISRVI